MRVLEMVDDAETTRAHGERRMKFRIEKSENLTKAIRRLAREQLELARTEVAPGRVSVGSIHNARKAIKRLRALLYLLTRVGDKGVVKTADRTLRDAGRLLSPARDIHVQWAAFKKLSVCDDPGVGRMLERKLAEKQAELTPANKTDLEKFVRMMAGVEKELSKAALHKFDAEALAIALKHSYRRARRGFKAVTSVSTGVKLHRWRKAAKSFWHHLQLVNAITGGDFKRQRKDTHLLTDHLGDDHDLFLLLELLKHEKDSESRAMKRELRKCRAKLEKRAFKLARQTFDLAPSAFHKRISRHLNQSKN
jgi:CHAD domain-containing protein